MGDFNINISDALLTTDKTVNEFYNTFLLFYFYLLINQPTKVHGVSKSIIDNIFTSSPNIIMSVLLNSSNIGGQIGHISLIIYADDLCLICLSSAGMQKLLNLCSKYAVDHSLKYNAKSLFRYVLYLEL